MTAPIRLALVALGFFSWAMLGSSTAMAEKNCPPKNKSDSARQACAGEHIGKGTEYLEEGRYKSAIRSFEKAYKTYPHADIYYNLALAHEKDGNKKEAIRYYRRFLKMNRGKNKGVRRQGQQEDTDFARGVERWRRR